MSAHHLLAPTVAGDRVTISGDDAHHAARVLRLREGERVTVGDGSGNVVDGVVSKIGRDVTVEVLARVSVPQPRPKVRIAQAIPKGSKFDQIVKELTEVGVDEILPVRTSRSIARWDGAGRMDRFRAIAWGAAKQSHRAWLPVVSDPIDLASLVIDHPTIVLHEQARARLSEVLPEEPVDTITLVVGPEGGFSDEEVEALVIKGADVGGLGPLILRTEAAGFAAAALTRGQYGLIG